MRTGDLVSKVGRPEGAKKRVDRNGNAGLTRNDRGFTLIDVIITLAITMVLAHIALPPIGNTIRSVRLGATSSTLAGDLARARIEALKRNQWSTSRLPAQPSTRSSSSA